MRISAATFWEDTEVSVGVMEGSLEDGGMGESLLSESFGL